MYIIKQNLRKTILGPSNDFCREKTLDILNCLSELRTNEPAFY